MNYQAGKETVKTAAINRNGFTFLMALMIIVIIGIMSAFAGKSWTMFMKREREKELLFRGNQIKEALENWYNPKYTVPGVQPRSGIRPLMDLKDLLQDPYSLTPIRYLPQSYAAEFYDKNPRCAPDCAKLKIYQDPITGREWTIIRGNIVNSGVTPITGTQGSIIGVASKSDDVPLKTDFKDTSLENMGSVAVPDYNGAPRSVFANVTSKSSPGLGDKITKYSEWKFIADPKNDHTKIYRSYHEGW